MSLASEEETGRKLPSGHIRSGKIGVLLVNLGTPDDTSYWPMRRYLKEFLSDRRVIEVNPLVWWPLLNLVILTNRPKRSGHAYQTIWNKELNESPLRTITRSQAAKLGGVLSALDGRIRVDWAMRYGNPSIASRLDALKAEGCDRILVAPLYPQYAAATTATVNDKAFEALMKMRWQPAVRTLPPYHDDPVYIDALAEETERALGRLDFEPEVILASFHGLLKDYVEKGDPYQEHCRETVRLLKARLGPLGEKLRLTFQSRFGRAEWLQPYTDETVRALGHEGVKRLAVITPGFAADCVETLEEIAVQNAEFFREHGGERFAALPCLNDGAAGTRLLEHLMRRELSGWM